jgi:hypothetical protein
VVADEEFRRRLVELFDSDAVEGIDIYGTGQPDFLIDAIVALPRYVEGHLPNRRGGFDHIHSGLTECGQAYRLPSQNWAPCRKLVNHDGGCGYADNTPY